MCTVVGAYTCLLCSFRFHHTIQTHTYTLPAYTLIAVDTICCFRFFVRYLDNSIILCAKFIDRFYSEMCCEIDMLAVSRYHSLNARSHRKMFVCICMCMYGSVQYAVLILIETPFWIGTFSRIIAVYFKMHVIPLSACSLPLKDSMHLWLLVLLPFSFFALRFIAVSRILLLLLRLGFYNRSCNRRTTRIRTLCWQVYECTKKKMKKKKLSECRRSR